ncbi:Pyrroline-5-carboxylate reductase [Caballeronia novacaledonica]|uniref:Pyrroline-5-carboxylate reductase n=1 Tax=Caballeronia novacaledonica TaxID=1544861 RepID=A0A2U3IAF5_9BURK|nr:NAD(P)-binding domain-containing protein [Caballeronia novacaledonica]SPB17191.1 Pyrroline-5-carboxylate reductase [Caballeronia novacaledonica]
MIKLGVLGVGDLTEKMIRGWHRASSDATFLLSPRSRARAESLARDIGCKLMRDNQEVADAADVVLIGVRPGQLDELAQEIRLKPDVPLISVVSGVPAGDLQRMFGARECTRAMLSLAAEINRSTVAIYPADSAMAPLLAALGNPVPLATEREFELATVGACMNGWFYFLLHDLQQWFVQKGFAPEDARQLVLSGVEDCVAYSRYKSSSEIGEIGSSIATAGTYTAQGLDVLQKLGANAAWQAACEHVFEQLTPKEHAHSNSNSNPRRE